MQYLIEFMEMLEIKRKCEKGLSELAFYKDNGELKWIRVAKLQMNMFAESMRKDLREYSSVVQWKVYS